MTIAEARQYLLAEFPGGLPKWLDVSPGPDPTNPQAGASDAWNFLDAAAQLLLDYGFNPAEAVDADAQPSQATLVGIAAWEGALGLTGSKIALYGGTEARRAQVIARLRESGASTIPNISAALAAICGPTANAFTILEHSRSALTTANTRTINTGDVTITGSGATTVSFSVSDNAPASNYGASVNLIITSGHFDALSYTLIAPDATTKQWAAQGTGSVTAQATWLWGKEFAGAQIDGTWQLVIVNANASASTLKANSTIFTEGIGRDAAGGAEGYAADIFEWSVLVDETLVTASTYDRDLCRSIVQRWNPAHCRGYLVIKNSSGGASGIWGDPTNSDWDGFTWA